MTNKLTLTEQEVNHRPLCEKAVYRHCKEQREVYPGNERFLRYFYGAAGGSKGYCIIIGAFCKWFAKYLQPPDKSG